MKKIVNYLILSTFVWTVSVGLYACSSDSGEEPEKPVAKTLTVDTNKIDFDSNANTTSVKVSGTVSSWTVSASGASWIELGQTSGTGTVTLSIKALANTSTSSRSATITISSTEAPSVQIAISQLGATVVGPTYPSYNTNPLPADATGMSSTAVQLAAKMKLGWNIGTPWKQLEGKQLGVIQK